MKKLMKVLALSVLFVFLAWVPGYAQDGARVKEALPGTQFDVTSYAGIVAAVIALVGGLKKMFKSWVDGKEPHLGLGLTMIIGIAAKLTVAGSFVGVSWVNHVVALLIAAAGAKLGHDYFVNQIVADKPAPDEKKKGKS